MCELSHTSTAFRSSRRAPPELRGGTGAVSRQEIRRQTGMLLFRRAWGGSRPSRSSAISAQNGRWPVAKGIRLLGISLYSLAARGPGGGTRARIQPPRRLVWGVFLSSGFLVCCGSLFFNRAAGGKRFFPLEAVFLFLACYRFAKRPSLSWVRLVPVTNRRAPRASRSALTSDGAARAGGCPTPVASEPGKGALDHPAAWHAI